MLRRKKSGGLASVINAMFSAVSVPDYMFVSDSFGNGSTTEP
jgi:hypothetical protein